MAATRKKHAGLPKEPGYTLHRIPNGKWRAAYVGKDAPREQHLCRDEAEGIHWIEAHQRVMARHNDITARFLAMPLTPASRRNGRAWAAHTSPTTEEHP